MDRTRVASELLKVAKELIAKNVIPSDKELDNFYGYVLQFYGRSGLYPFVKNGRYLNKKDIAKATFKVLKSNHKWVSDSFDREKVAFILENEGWLAVKAKEASVRTAEPHRVNAAASPKTIDDLSASEKKVALSMKEKGYQYAVQITTIDGDFGDPLYFKSSTEVGPFLRTFPDYKNAKTKWSLSLLKK